MTEPNKISLDSDTIPSEKWSHDRLQELCKTKLAPGMDALVDLGVWCIAIVAPADNSQKVVELLTTVHHPPYQIAGYLEEMAAALRKNEETNAKDFLSGDPSAR